MGRHIPRLSFLSIVLSDEEALTPAEDCYHRLNRTGEHDEMELVENFLESHSKSELFDTVLIPAVIAAGRDHRAGLLESDQLDFIEDGVRHILEDLEVRQEARPAELDGAEEPACLVCCVPARAYRDELAGEMLSQLLRQDGHSVRNASAKMVSGELVSWVSESRAKIVCISAVTPSTGTHARYLCARLRSHFPKLTILVGLWGAPVEADDAKTLQEAGADDVLSTIAEATRRVAARAPDLPSPAVDEKPERQLAT
jgi:methylmalonyl-CoA mutase cobalamin-binding subunit